VDTVPQLKWRQLGEAEQPAFQRTRFFWLKNPANLQREEQPRLSGLLRLNTHIVKVYLLKENPGPPGTTGPPPGPRPDSESGSGGCPKAGLLPSRSCRRQFALIAMGCSRGPRSRLAMAPWRA
jgi:hypothetical protein